MSALNNGYRWKLSMFWGSKWRTYFGLYYAFTEQAAYAATKEYNFPITKNRGWAIEELSTGEVTFSSPEDAIEASTKSVWHPIKRRF